MRPYLEHYRDCSDATLTERRDDGDRLEFMLLASGGGIERAYKESARRAFVRCVMREMHARDLDISVVVC